MNENNTVTNNDTVTDKKNPGPSKKTREECLDAFEEFTTALELTNLRMSTDHKGRHSIIKDVDGVQTAHVVGPLAGNSFVKLLRSAKDLVVACKVA